MDVKELVLGPLLFLALDSTIIGTCIVEVYVTAILCNLFITSSMVS